MTPKQEERIRKKIKDIKAVLAVERKKFGDYFDSRGLRYAPQGLFIQLEDYSGATKYAKWFDKHFPTDMAYPDFLLERAILLFKCNKLPAARQKAFQCFTLEPEVFNLYLNVPVVQPEILAGLNPVYNIDSEYKYSSMRFRFPDFSAWLEQVAQDVEFSTRCIRYIAIQKLRADKTNKSRFNKLTREAEELINLPF